MAILLCLNGCEALTFCLVCFALCFRVGRQSLALLLCLNALLLSLLHLTVSLRHGCAALLLPRSDVDLDAGVIHVRQRANAWGKMGPPKSKAGKRDIPLAPIVVNTLRAWRPSSRGELVFGTRTDRALGMSNFRCHEWEPLLRRVGMEDKYNFHLLRHAAASLFIAYLTSLFIAYLNWTPKRIQTVMRHSSVQMTFDLYGHLFEDKEPTARLWRGLRLRLGLLETYLRHAGRNRRDDQYVSSNVYGPN